NEKGDALAALKSAAKVVEADYEVTYLAHATMEPMNCTAQVTPERVDVWLGTQNPEGSLAAAAEVTGVAPENVYVHTCFLGRGFARMPSKTASTVPRSRVWRIRPMPLASSVSSTSFRTRMCRWASGARLGPPKTPLPSKALWMSWRTRRGKIRWSFGACSSRA